MSPKLFQEKLSGLLGVLQRRSKTDLMYLFRSGFWLTLGQLGTIALSLLLAVAFANLLPRTTFGLYQYVLSISAILIALTLEGMIPAVIQAVARNYVGSVLVALKTRLRWSVLASLVSLCLAGYYYMQDSFSLSMAFVFTTIFIPVIGPLSLYDAILQGKKRFDASAKYQILAQFAIATVLVIALLMTDNLLLILLAYFIPFTLVRSLALRNTLREISPTGPADPDTLIYARHSGFLALISTLAAYLDRLIVFHFLGPAELAAYSFAIGPVAQLKVAFKNMPKVAVPKLAPHSVQRINELINRWVILLFLSGIVMALIYAVAVPYLFRLLFPKYLDSIRLSQLYSISFIFYLPSLVFTSIGEAKVTLIPKRILYLGSLLPQLALIGLLAILGYLWGAQGVITAKILFTLLALIGGAITWSIVVRHHRDK